VPVIGLVQVGDQAWADRYAYIPLIGLFISLSWGAADLIKSRLALQIAGVAVAAALIIGTSVQLRYWKNTRTLFEHAANVTHENCLAVTMLGSLLAQEGKLDEAIEYYRTALHYKPGFPEAHFFLGNAFDKQGKLDDAITEYQKALWFKPTQEQTHIFLGVALAKQKKYDQAAEHYLAALKLNPESALAHNNLAKLFHTEGKLDAAIEHYQLALKFDPRFAQAHNNLGIALMQKGDPSRAEAELREALRLNPGDRESEYNLALVLNRQEKWSEAAELFAKTVDPNSTDPNAHYQFAVALAHSQKTQDALSQYASALLLQPDFPDALDGLSWILSTNSDPKFRNGAEAVRMAQRACELTGEKDPEKLKTLSAAYAEAGRFDDAVASAQRAHELAGAAGRTDLARECERMLESFKAAKPWR
jgi:tetratricopeptide (TPR) repeat protein